MKLYIDLDGVLADFDKAAEAQLQTNNIYKFEFIWGDKVFWERMNAKEDFFRTLPKTPDANHLWAKIEHLKPTILTALPRTNPERVDAQKRAWVKANFGDVPVVTCKTEHKPEYCNPGDILIDDRAVNRDAWIKKGGTYVIHTSAANTLTTLRALGVIN